MDSPSSTTRIAARSSMIDSIRGCGLSGMRIDKEDLRRKLSIPEYLRVAMSNAIRRKEGEPPADTCQSDVIVDGNGVQPPEAPMVVFINSRSGGRHGPELKERLQELMGKEQVFDLSEVKPHEFVQYGLACLEKLAELGDFCAKDTRQKMRIVVAGGDGTVGWVLGSVGELNKQGREPVPPVAIIPLGTGNDLSRSFGWGGSFPFAWKSAVKRTLQRASAGPICRLDSWHAVIQMPSGEVVDPPHSLKPTEDCALDQGLQIEGALPEKVNCYEGVFYNYFSIGMDAQVAYGFHHLRNEKPYLAQGPISNKLIYSGYSCTQGWFLTPCISDPNLRGLKNILRMHVKKVNCSEWEQVAVPKSVRAIVALNLHNYASGRNPWGNLSPEYLEKAAAIRLEFRGGEWKDAFMQMDGEPWKQPLNRDYSTFVEIKRVPFQSLMISGE
ncbi:hypothetical protein CICLE_v10008147mg [Citrus x clementina]|uniref:Diacylglycerol kinase n=2 Tax=Citrus TaxID=2706 RepID=V4UVJ5_CITCL|nr:diacylglycerol kinase 3 isoform X2 [Citrus x clementina]ESR66696.1 hypothetical protein CICLE_v10008147mg [Citrus x clementina]